MGEVLQFDPSRRVRHRPPSLPPSPLVPPLSVVPYLWPLSFALTATALAVAIMAAAASGSAP